MCVQKLAAEELAPLSDRIMQLLLQVFNARGAIAHEDAFMSIGFMADKLGNFYPEAILSAIPAT